MMVTANPALRAALGLAVLTAPALAATDRLAVDGLTRVDSPALVDAGSAATARGSAADLVYFEEDGGAAGVRGLYDLDSSTGSSSLRTPVSGSERIFALAVQPGTGTVFGVDPIVNRLYTVDVTSGAVAFFVQLTGVSTVANLSFHPTTGVLYASGRNSLILYTVDLATGNATQVGQMASARSGLAFAPDGTLYGTALNGKLYRIDTATAAETPIGSGSGPGLAEDAAVRADGAMFVTDYDGDVFQIDTTTGVNTFVGNSGSGNGLLGLIADNSGCPAGQPSTELVRVGTPANPAALLPGLSSGPVIGATWDPFVDHTGFVPSAVIDLLAVHTRSINLPSAFGTILCDLTAPGLLTSATPGVPFALAVPADCALVGTYFCAQAASLDAASTVGLTNALDVVVGAF